MTFNTPPNNKTQILRTFLIQKTSFKRMRLFMNTLKIQWGILL